MHLVLHIGMPKTGSTALQRNLADNRESLRERGVLYPRLSHLSHAHHLLMPLVLPPAVVWGRVRDCLGPDPAQAALAQWQAVLRQVRQQGPEAVVLSTEALFSPSDPDRLSGFAGLLRDVADRFTLVAYVREPSKYYGAILMEMGKRSSQPRPAKPVPYRQPIEQLRDALGAVAVVRAFDRAALHRADITSDFLLHALGIELPGVPVVDRNASLAPETTAVFQQFMEAKTSSRRWALGAAETLIIRDLLRLEREVGRPATALRPEVAERVTYASKDLLWLRDAFGIAFDGVDYERLLGPAASGVMAVRSLRDAFDFDEAFHRHVLDAACAKYAGFRQLLSDAA